MTEAWRARLRRVAGRTRESFMDGRQVCDGVSGRLRYELRLTWLGGMRILERLRSHRLRRVRTPSGSGRRRCAVALMARVLLAWSRAAVRRGETMKQRATSFYYSFLALPAAKRNAIIAVWDFCRAVDDAVDEPGERDPVQAITQWREEVARVYDGREPGTPEGKRLLPFTSGPFHCRAPRSKT